jgi:hypothetical protein
MRVGWCIAEDIERDAGLDLLLASSVAEARPSRRQHGLDQSLKLVGRAADRETGRRRSLLASSAIIREALFLAKAPRERLTDLPSSQNALGDPLPENTTARCGLADATHHEKRTPTLTA